MNYWLVKSEPDVYGWDHLVKEKEGTWDGVRNYQARNNLKAMKKGDLVLFYHSQTTKDVVGVAEVSKEFFPDPTTDDAAWVSVKLKPYKKFVEPVTLTAIKANEKITELIMLRNGRLSVMPVSKTEFNEIVKMAKTKL
ncbi:MAG TPA: EVE domain-containing protein [Flavobacteriales bacterium]|nr:EVE domain-containing protein [Flavobacteriales bacterium]